MLPKQVETEAWRYCSVWSAQAATLNLDTSQPQNVKHITQLNINQANDSANQFKRGTLQPLGHTTSMRENRKPQVTLAIVVTVAAVMSKS